MDSIIGIIIVSLSIGLPAWALASLRPEDEDPVARWTVGGLVALFGMPALAFSLAALLGTNMNAWMLVGLGVGTTGLLLVWRRRRDRPPAS